MGNQQNEPNKACDNYAPPYGFCGESFSGMILRCAECTAKAALDENLERREAKKRFESTLEKLERRNPAAALQVTMAWPAHAREDDTAEWWSAHAPYMIEDMKEQM